MGDGWEQPIPKVVKAEKCRDCGADEWELGQFMSRGIYRAICTKCGNEDYIRVERS